MGVIPNRTVQHGIDNTTQWSDKYTGAALFCGKHRTAHSKLLSFFFSQQLATPKFDFFFCHSILITMEGEGSGKGFKKERGAETV